MSKKGVICETCLMMQQADLLVARGEISMAFAHKALESLRFYPVVLILTTGLDRSASS